MERTSTVKVQKKLERLRPLELKAVRQHEQTPVQAVAPRVVYRHAQINHNGSTPADFLVMQRTVGNRIVQRKVVQRIDKENSQPAPALTAENPGIEVQTKTRVGAFNGVDTPVPFHTRTQTPLLQRSPLSDSVDSLWKANQSRDAILDRLSKDDAFANRTDADLQKSLTAIFKDQNDLWLAQKVLNRQLGESEGKFRGRPLKLPIELLFFKGVSSEKALVIAGVHGSERQGIEVTEMLKVDLAAQRPHFNVILVPSLFPVNAKNRIREGSNQTNRNFPEPGKTLAEAKKNRRGEPLDADGDKILIENQLLIQLIKRFQPSRIISIHGTQYAHQAGVFSDPITTKPDPAKLLKAAADLALNMYSQIYEGNPQFVNPYDLQYLTFLMYDYLEKELEGRNTAQTKRDLDLSIKTAQAVAKDTNKLTGLKTRHQSSDILKQVASKLKSGTAEYRKAVENLKQNPAVAGNKLDQPSKNQVWSGETKGGVSLGGYAPSHGISVFTVEPAINRESSSYPQATLDPDVSQVERKAELQAYADAIRTILLGQ